MVNSEMTGEFYTRLYKQYRTRLVDYAGKRVQCLFLAEDVVQNVFIKLWMKRDRLQIRDLKSYLFIMVRNECCNELSRQRCHLLEPDLVQEQAGCRAEDRVLLREYQQFLQQAINRLPPRRRQIYTLSFLEGMPVHCIASGLKICRSTVKNQLVRARGEVRGQLSDVGCQVSG